jgi:hypothetical protein
VHNGPQIKKEDPVNFLIIIVVGKQILWIPLMQDYEGGILIEQKN